MTAQQLRWICEVCGHFYVTFPPVAGAVNHDNSTEDLARWLPPHDPFLYRCLAGWTVTKASWLPSIGPVEHDQTSDMLVEQCPVRFVDVDRARS